MRRILSANPAELNSVGLELEAAGCYTLAAVAYERCLFLGLLDYVGYVRLAKLYRRQGRASDCKRVIARWRAVTSFLRT